MEEICKWLLANWRLVLEVVLLFFSVVVFLVKKKPVKVVDTIKEFIVQLLPHVINFAEKAVGSGNGVNKKEVVINRVLKSIEVQFQLTEDQALSYLQFIQKQIEVILSTPQKKGE